MIIILINLVNKMTLILGQTMGKVIVNLGEKEFAVGLAYTACTRVKTVRDLYFNPFPNGHR